MTISTVSDSRPADLRRLSFLTIAIALILFLYLFSPFSSLFLGWFVDFEDNISHRVHEVTFGMLFAMILAGIAVQVRSPEKNIAGLQQAIVVAAALTVVVTASTGWEWTALLYLVPPLALAAFHPRRRRVLSVPGFPGGQLGFLALAAALPFAFELMEEFDKAVNGARGHQAHWGGMAAFAIVLPVLVALAATGTPGWRLPAWSAGGATIVYGVSSLAFPFDASAATAATSVVAILWGLRVVYVAERGRSPVRSAPAHAQPETPVTVPVLRRARRGRWAGGVCSGLARRYRMPVGPLRALVFVPIVGLVAYAVAWWRIPLEQPGEPVEPGPGGASEPVRSVLAGLAAAILLFAGLFVYGFTESIVAPAVPHDIESTAARTCLTCHATGLGAAPIIDPLTHNYFDEIRERRSSVPFCGDCHRLPAPTRVPASGALSPAGPAPAGHGYLGPADLLRVRRLLAEAAE